MLFLLLIVLLIGLVVFFGFKNHKSNSASAAQELAEWANLRDNKIITEDQFLDKRRELLNRHH